jgi:hypothetical protein
VALVFGCIIRAPAGRYYIKGGIMSLDCLEVGEDEDELELYMNEDGEEELDEDERSLIRLHAELQTFEDAQVTLSEYDDEEDDDYPEEWATYPYSPSGQWI